jgi:hypothetical protein
MTQAVRHWPVTAEAWVYSQVSPHEVCYGQSGIGTGFSLSFSVLLCQYHSTMALHTHISSGRSTTCPLVTAVQRHSLIPVT